MPCWKAPIRECRVRSSPSMCCYLTICARRCSPCWVTCLVRIGRRRCLLTHCAMSAPSPLTRPSVTRSFTTSGKVLGCALSQPRSILPPATAFTMVNPELAKFSCAESYCPPLKLLKPLNKTPPNRAGYIRARHLCPHHLTRESEQSCPDYGFKYAYYTEGQYVHLSITFVDALHPQSTVIPRSDLMICFVGAATLLIPPREFACQNVRMLHSIFYRPTGREYWISVWYGEGDTVLEIKVSTIASYAFDGVAGCAQMSVAPCPGPRLRSWA